MRSNTNQIQRNLDQLKPEHMLGHPRYNVRKLPAHTIVAFINIASRVAASGDEGGSMSWLSCNIKGFIRDVVQPMTLVFHIQDPEYKDGDLISMIAGMRAEDASYTLPERINKKQDSDADSDVDRKQGLLLQALRSIDPAHSKRGFHKKHRRHLILNQRLQLHQRIRLDRY